MTDGLTYSWLEKLTVCTWICKCFRSREVGIASWPAEDCRRWTRRTFTFAGMHDTAACMHAQELAVVQTTVGQLSSLAELVASLRRVYIYREHIRCKLTFLYKLWKFQSAPSDQHSRGGVRRGGRWICKSVINSIACTEVVLHLIRNYVGVILLRLCLECWNWISF